METASSNSLVITKKTGALVFFIGCAVGLIVSEILVGVASQKAQQDAHKASLDYIEQVRHTGNGSFIVKQEAHRAEKPTGRWHHDRPVPVGISHGGVLLTRRGTHNGKATLEKATRQLEEQKMRNRLNAERGGKASSSGKNHHDHQGQKAARIPDTIGLIRMKGSRHNGVLARICSNKNDKDCGRNIKTHSNRIRRRARSKHHYDVKAAVVDQDLLRAMTALSATIPQNSKSMVGFAPAAAILSPVLGATPVVLTAVLPPTVAGSTPVVVASGLAKDLSHIKGPVSPLETTSLFKLLQTRIQGTKTKKQGNSTKKLGKTSKPKAIKNPSTALVTPPPGNVPPGMTRKERKDRKRLKNAAKRMKSNSPAVTWPDFPFAAKEPSNVQLIPVSSPIIVAVPIGNRTATLHPLPSFPNKTALTDRVLTVSKGVRDSLDLPLEADARNRKRPKSDRACRRMMKDMEAFEKDEKQKSEELMMVSFRDGVDEVQSLMHIWIKTPVHVMEGITFFSILICLVLYWVEDSIQNRLRKIGFNI